MKKTTILRRLLRKDKILVAPGAYNALTAKIIEKAGFRAVYVTGYGVSSTFLGKPDVGLITMSEMVTNIRNIAGAVKVPLIADADTGYGNVINVIRTVEEYEKAGAAAIQLEDQVFPKKCGHVEHRTRKLIPIEEMEEKIKASVEAREDKDFVIIARTDARVILGIDEVIKRGNRYARAGADIIFPEAPSSLKELEILVGSIDARLMVNMVEKGRTPLLTVQELERIGCAIIIFPISILLSAVKAGLEVMCELKKQGTTKKFLNRMISFDDFNDFVGFSEVKELESKYGKGTVKSFMSVPSKRISSCQCKSGQGKG